MMRKQTSKM